MIPAKYCINPQKIDTKLINKSYIVKSLDKAISENNAISTCELTCILSIIDPEKYWDYVLCKSTNISVLFHIYQHYKKNYALEVVYDYYNSQEFRNIQAEIAGILCFPIKYNKINNIINKPDFINFISIMTDYYIHKKLSNKMQKMKHQKIACINTATPELIELVLRINIIYSDTFQKLVNMQLQIQEGL